VCAMTGLDVMTYDKNQKRDFERVDVSLFRFKVNDFGPGFKFLLVLVNPSREC
jgi:hypothetical protein